MSAFHQQAAYDALALHLAGLAQTAPSGLALKQACFRSGMFTAMADRPDNAEEIFQRLATLEDHPVAAGNISERQQASDSAQRCAPALPQAHYAYTSPEGLLLLFLKAEFAFGLIDVPALLKKIEQAREVHLHINSCGGDMSAAIALYSALEGKCSQSTAYGKCWSAATLPFMAASVRRVAMDTTLMVHAGVAAAYGNVATLRQAATGLEATNERARAIYSTHIEPATVNKWLAHGDHWLTLEQALECGLATEIITNPMSQ